MEGLLENFYWGAREKKSMIKWKPASVVFLGGTKEALGLKGRKVKNRVALFSSPLYDPVHHKNNTVDVKASSIGILANAIGNELLVAYSITPGVAPASLEALMRTNTFFVIKVNWPTFRMQFDIEG